jgi:hypothetical protein
MPRSNSASAEGMGGVATSSVQRATWHAASRLAHAQDLSVPLCPRVLAAQCATDLRDGCGVGIRSQQRAHSARGARLGGLMQRRHAALLGQGGHKLEAGAPTRPNLTLRATRQTWPLSRCATAGLRTGPGTKHAAKLYGVSRALSASSRLVRRRCKDRSRAPRPPRPRPPPPARSRPPCAPLPPPGAAACGRPVGGASAGCGARALAAPCTHPASGCRHRCPRDACGVARDAAVPKARHVCTRQPGATGSGSSPGRRLLPPRARTHRRHDPPCPRRSRALCG